MRLSLHLYRRSRTNSNFAFGVTYSLAQVSTHLKFAEASRRCAFVINTLSISKKPQGPQGPTHCLTEAVRSAHTTRNTKSQSTGTSISAFPSFFSVISNFSQGQRHPSSGHLRHLFLGRHGRDSVALRNQHVVDYIRNHVSHSITSLCHLCEETRQCIIHLLKRDAVTIEWVGSSFRGPELLVIWYRLSRSFSSRYWRNTG